MFLKLLNPQVFNPALNRAVLFLPWVPWTCETFHLAGQVWRRSLSKSLDLLLWPANLDYRLLSEGMTERFVSPHL